MDSIIRVLPLAFFALTAITVHAQQTPEYGYIQPIQEELTRMNIPYHCNAVTGHCILMNETDTARSPAPLNLLLNDRTATIYLYYDHVVRFADTVLPHELSLQLLEFNARMIVPKLEFHPADRNIRLSAVLHTDSNFDRKAFRSIVRGLMSAATTVEKTLRPASEP